MNLILRNIGRFLLLMVLQVLVLNNIYLGGFITPFLYVLFILMLPTSLPKVAMLLIAFASGLTVDVFSNVMGFHAMAATFVAFCRITFADKILTRGEAVTIDTPSTRSVAIGPMLFYLALMLFLFYALYFLLVYFSFHDFFRILLSALLSTFFTWLLAILYQSIFIKKEHKS